MKDQEAALKQVIRTDKKILDSIWHGLWKKGTIRSLDIDHISVEVRDGEVFLSGHISKEYNRDLIENTARSVPGVKAVHNNLVVDYDLTLQVAQALSKDERTRPFILPTGASHGWIRLGGEVPTRELQLAAEEVAAQVPAVRGVLTLPRVTGESQEPARRPIQPRVGSKVYDGSGLEGIATQVVIQPCNRLVTHVAVSVNGGIVDGKLVSGEYLVPVEAIDQADDRNIFLKRNGPPLNAYPVFNPAHYPLAPSSWQPPYPYTAGTVRWPKKPGQERVKRPEKKLKKDQPVARISPSPRLVQET